MQEIFVFGEEGPHCPKCGAGTTYNMASAEVVQKVQCRDPKCGKVFYQESLEEEE